MGISKINLGQALFISLPVLGYLVFGWSPNSVLLAMIWSLVIQALASIIWSFASLTWWRHHRAMSLPNYVAESYLALGANVIAVAIIGGMFLLPPVVLQDPYLMYSTTYDARFFQTLFQVSSFSDITWYVSLASLAIPIINNLVRDFKTNTHQNGNTRILQFEWQNHTPMDTTAFLWIALSFIVTYVAYYFAFSVQSITLMLLIITAWRIGSLYDFKGRSQKTS